MKIIAMYLPQFHRIPENDLWWGEGFTEWTAVKAATPLFEGHAMPREPKDKNYYNLLDKETMQWQAELMHKYNLYGMCFYHYYFKDGRKILEKPAENLLKWKDIDIHFCFSWANETWARSWSNISSKNVWSLNNDSNIDGNGILLQQSYGNRDEWEKHFNYLLPFFLDIRYIKINNKPVFLIYKADEIYCLSEMMDLWNQLAIKNGLNGVYFISTNSSVECDANLFMEPQYTLSRSYSDKYKKSENKITAVINYDDIVQKSISWQNNVMHNGKKIYLSVFPGYDDTPRRSKAGIAVIKSNPNNFCIYLKEILKKSIELENDFVFINAWNEWGETMYLEPDEEWGYGYLEAVESACRECENLSFNEKKELTSDRFEEVVQAEKKINQYRSYWKILDKWLWLKEKNISLDSFFLEKNINKIAVYGLGMLGNHFIIEINHSNIDIIYGIDGKGNAININFPVFTLDDSLPKNVDLVVVTATYDYVFIKKQLEKKGIKKIISLEEIVSSLYEQSL